MAVVGAPTHARARASERASERARGARHVRAPRESSRAGAVVAAPIVRRGVPCASFFCSYLTCRLHDAEPSRVRKSESVWPRRADAFPSEPIVPSPAAAPPNKAKVEVGWRCVPSAMLCFFEVDSAVTWAEAASWKNFQTRVCMGEALSAPQVEPEVLEVLASKHHLEEHLHHPCPAGY